MFQYSIKHNRMDNYWTHDFDRGMPAACHHCVSFVSPPLKSCVFLSPIKESFRVGGEMRTLNMRIACNFRVKHGVSVFGS